MVPRSACAGLLSCCLGLFVTSCSPKLTTKEPPAKPKGDPPAKDEGVKAPGLRLPPISKPLGYKVDLTLDPALPKETFTGQIEIQLVILEPTRRLWLNGRGLRVHKASLRQGGVEMSLSAQAIPPEHLLFVAPGEIAKGEATLTLTYEGQVSTRNNDGLFLQKEEGLRYLYTDFEPIDARKVFPCFDEPSYKVPWELSLTVPKDQVAVANTSAVSEESLGEQKRVRFAKTTPLPSYLIAFSVGPFDFVDAGKVGRKATPVRIIVPKGKGAQASYAASATVEILKVLEDYFDRPYPFDKLDLISVPLQSGAMENAGLVTFRQSLMLSPKEAQSLRFRRVFASVCAHELAHQWFGDLVTTAYWDDLWLNESFATWMETKVLSKWQPGWREEVGEVASRSGAMGVDSLRSARRIRQPIEKIDDIYNAFDGITYGKGSAVLGMFDQYLGPDVFRKGVQIYLERHAHKNARAEDFLAALSESAKTDVAPLFYSFLDQPGVPLLLARLSCSADKPQAPSLLLSQRRYLPMGSEKGGDERALWQVPLCVRTVAGKDRSRACAVLKEETARIPLPVSRCPDLVFGNEGGVGYYRMLYEGDQLARLVKEVGNPKGALTQTERLTLLYDQAALVRTGDVPAKEALALIEPFARDPQHEMVEGAVRMMSGVYRLLPDALLENYGRFVRKVFGPRAKGLGFFTRKGESEDNQLLRPQLISLLGMPGEDPEILAEADRLARRWLKGTVQLEPEMLGIVLGLAARRGDRSLFEGYQAALPKVERRDRNRIYAALGSFVNPELRKRALQLLLSKDVEIREASGLLSTALSDRKGGKIAYAFLKEHLDELIARLPEQAGAGIPRYVVPAFCDEEGRTDMKAFFTGRTTKYFGGERILTQALEQVAICKAVSEKQRQSLEEFFR